MGLVRLVAAVTVVTGCGRIDFTSRSDGGPHSQLDGPADGADAPDSVQVQPWQLLQVNGAGSSAAPATSLPIVSTTAGSLLAVAIEMPSTASSVQSVTDDAGNLYVLAPGAIATNNINI